MVAGNRDFPGWPRDQQVPIEWHGLNAIADCHNDSRLVNVQALDSCAQQRLPWPCG
jgi:hypothetical protein